jgi:hypothetical protein
VVGESIKHEASQEMTGPATDDMIELVNRGD